MNIIYLINCYSAFGSHQSAISSAFSLLKGGRGGYSYWRYDRRTQRSAPTLTTLLVIRNSPSLSFRVSAMNILYIPPASVPEGGAVHTRRDCLYLISTFAICSPMRTRYTPGANGRTWSPAGASIVRTSAPLTSYRCTICGASSVRCSAPSTA